MKSRRNWDSTSKVLYNLQQIGTNGERQFMKSPGVDINLTDDDHDNDVSDSTCAITHFLAEN